LCLIFFFFIPILDLALLFMINKTFYVGEEKLEEE